MISTLIGAKREVANQQQGNISDADDWYGEAV